MFSCIYLCCLAIFSGIGMDVVWFSGFWLFGDISFEYWDGRTMCIMRSVDVLYGDGAVSDHIVGYIKF